MTTPLPKSIGRPATNALEEAKISCLEDLANISEEELINLHGVGPKALRILLETLEDNKMNLKVPSKVTLKKTKIIDGYTIKYHANGVTRWSKGKIVAGHPDGYWEWYRPDGTLKRSGHFEQGKAVGEWITYDANGKVYKITNK